MFHSHGLDFRADGGVLSFLEVSENLQISLSFLGVEVDMA